MNRFCRNLTHGKPIKGASNLPMQAVPRQLRELLTELYPTEKESRRVVEDAQMVWVNIEFSSSANVNWQEILRDAYRRRKVTALLDIAAKDYAERKFDVIKAKLAYLTSLAEVSLEELYSMYRHSCASTCVRHVPIDSLDSALTILWNIVDQHDRYFPVLEFAQRYARLIQDLTVKQALQTWIEWTVASGMLNVQTHDLEQLRYRLDSEAQEGIQANTVSYLLVELYPDPYSHKSAAHQRYNVKISHWKSDQDIECWYEQGVDRSRKLEEIPQLIYTTLSEHEDEKPAIIEFFLPYEILTDKVDQWQFQISPFLKRKLCSKYKIVIRSWDRMRDPQLGFVRQEWREKWGAFQKASEQRAIFWLENPNDYEQQHLYDELTHPQKKHSCLGLTFVPPVGRGEKAKKSLLATILMAGVPVMLWSRKSQQPHHTIAEIKQELEHVLCSENLDKLPDIVHALRIEAYTEQHLGCHLALFWDDPNRQPKRVNQNQSAL